MAIPKEYSFLRFSVKSPPRFCDFPFFIFINKLKIASMKRSIFVYTILVFMVLQSCTITKRYHTRGVNIQWHNNYKTKNNGTVINKRTYKTHPIIDLAIPSNQSTLSVKPKPVVYPTFVDSATESSNGKADSLSPELIKLRRTKKLANSFAIAAGASFSGAGLIVAAVPNRGAKYENAVWGFIAAILMFPVVLLFIILYSITMRRYRKLLKKYQST